MDSYVVINGTILVTKVFLKFSQHELPNLNIFFTYAFKRNTPNQTQRYNFLIKAFFIDHKFSKSIHSKSYTYMVPIFGMTIQPYSERLFIGSL